MIALKNYSPATSACRCLASNFDVVSELQSIVHLMVFANNRSKSFRRGWNGPFQTRWTVLKRLAPMKPASKAKILHEEQTGFLSEFVRSLEQLAFRYALNKLAEIATQCSRHFSERQGRDLDGIVDFEHKADEIVEDIHELHSVLAWAFRPADGGEVSLFRGV